MNIKTNEILLLNKIRFGEGENTNTTVQAPVPEVSNPQNGMNALMFQGLKNLMADPELAQEVGVATEDKAENNSSSKAYVAPYATNMVSFGNKKSLAKAALVGALALGTAGTMTSCHDRISINIDLAAIADAVSAANAQLMAKIAELEAKADARAEKQAQQLQLIVGMFTSLLNQVTDVQSALAVLQSQQQAMIGYMEENGKDIKDIKIQLNDIYDRLASEEITIQQAVAEITALLTSIDANVASILDQVIDFKEQFSVYTVDAKAYAEAMLANQNTQINNQQTLIAQGQELNSKVSNLITIGNTQVAKQNEILSAIKQANIDNNAKLDMVAKAIGWETMTLAKAIKKSGKSIEQVINMNASEIKTLLEEDIAVNRNALSELSQLRADFNSARITAAQYAQKVSEILSNIDTNVSNIYTEVISLNYKVDALRAEASEYATKIIENQNYTRADIQNLHKTVKDISTTTKTIVSKENEIIANINRARVENNMSIAMLAQQIGWSTYELAQVIANTGKSIEEVMNMNAGEIKQLLQENIDATNNNGTKLDQLRADYEAGRITAEQYAKQIQETLEKMSGQLEDISAKLDTFTNQFNVMIAQLGFTNAQLSYLNSQVKNLRAQVEAGNMTLEQMKKTLLLNTEIQKGLYAKMGQNNVLLQQLIADVEAGNKTAEEAWAIIEGQLGTLIDLNESILSSMKAVLAKLDVTNSKLAEMQKTFDSYYADFKAGKISAEQFYQKVYNYMFLDTAQKNIIIAQLVKNGKTQAEANNLIQTLINKVDQGTITAQEAWSTIEAQLDQVIDSLAEIKAELASLTKTVKSEDAQIKSLLAKLLKEGKITNAQLNEINQRLEGQKGNLARIENLIAKIESNSSNSVSKEDMAELISWLNIQQEVRQDELLSVAKKGLANQKTIINLMGKIAQLVNTNPSYAAELNKIYQKLVDIQNDNRSAEAAKATQINNIQVELNNIEAKINNIDANLDQLVSQIGTLLRSIETFQGRVDGKLNTIINLLKDANKNLASLNTEAQLTNTYIQQLKSKVVELGDKIDNIKIEQGGSLTEAQLRAILQERDADNFEKYKALLLFLHAEDMDAAKKNLDAIDENNRILLEILAAIKNLPTEIQVKVAALLEEWDPCCTDGCNDKIHEGIIDLIGGNNSRAAKASRKA